jgi:hypothetical protein
LWYPRNGRSYPEFDEWLEKTIKKKGVLDCLQDLYSAFGILPAPVLVILSYTHKLLWTRPEPITRDARQRRADCKAIDRTLKVMETYPAYSPFFSFNGLLPNKEERKTEAIAKNYLKTLKQAVKMIRPKKQSDVEMRFCAQALADFFHEITGKPQRERVGSLLVHAFNWSRGQSVAGDLRLATLQRAKGPSIITKQLALRDAINLQNRNYQFWEEEERYWAGNEWKENIADPLPSRREAAKPKSDIPNG